MDDNRESEQVSEGEEQELGQVPEGEEQTEPVSMSYNTFRANIYPNGSGS